MGPEGAISVALSHWGLECAATVLPGDRDLNFHLIGPDGAFVLKVTDACQSEIELSAAALERLAGSSGSLAVGLPLATLDAQLSCEVIALDGRSHRAWIVRWVEGVPLAHAGPRAPGLLCELGQELGKARMRLEGWVHEGLDRGLKWDLRRGLEVAWGHESQIENSIDRRLVRETLAGVGLVLESRMEGLRVGVIHGDGNDHNLLVKDAFPASGACGLLDVGDIDRSWVIAEPAIAAAYLMLDEDDPLGACVEFVAGYNETDPIPDEELEILLDLARLRLCVSVGVAAAQRALEPDNEYLSVTTESALRLLRFLQRADRSGFNHTLLDACGGHASSAELANETALLSRRKRALAPNLSLSYSKPLNIVRGEGRYLFDSGGAAYLDCVNNVPHVGHCHPDVVAAGAAQMGELNTNTRYLSDVRVRFAERLLATLPDSLDVVYLVNSGSEANELAMRLARAHSGGSDWVVLGAAYHGNTAALVELSPYKFNGPGGSGGSEHVSVAALPDRYRGEWGYEETNAGELYAEDVLRCVREIKDAGKTLAGFIAESIPGCGGQVVLPNGYLAAAYDHVRSEGGVVIADEVQVGCGRVGTHWWAFETQGVTPDIVTIGKPLGNGHPVGAVVTSAAVARSFDSGMEYFNTFGGNPVSCAMAEAVLKVVENEDLRENARITGERLLYGLRELAGRSPRLGDVRGLGLYIGIVCVTADGDADPHLAERVVEGARRRGVLLSTDGPLHDVIKIKPPIVFLPDDADHLVSVLDRAFNEAISSS